MSQEVAVEDKLPLERRDRAPANNRSAGVVALPDPQAATGRHHGSVPPLARLVAKERLFGGLLQKVAHNPGAGEHAWEVRGLDRQDLEGVHVDVERVVDWVAAADLPLRACPALQHHVDVVHVVHLEGALAPAGDAPLNVWDLGPVQLLRKGDVPVELDVAVRGDRRAAGEAVLREVPLLARFLRGPAKPASGDLDLRQQLRALPAEGRLEDGVAALLQELDDDVVAVPSTHQQVGLADLEEAGLVQLGGERLSGGVVHRLRPRDPVRGDHVERHDLPSRLLVDLEPAHPLRRDAGDAEERHGASPGLEGRLVFVVDQVGVHGRERHLVWQEVVQLHAAPVEDVGLLLVEHERVVGHLLIADAHESPLRVPDAEEEDVLVRELELLRPGDAHQGGEQ
mmetsp:Transcript_72642/g.190419  ORF Transcript_72642/g.190419 Transcript_72642/m.190419 type:complete len:397 (-) Transcript_72642:628-1818(-)